MLIESLEILTLDSNIRTTSQKTSCSMAPHTSTTRAMRKTRSMAPAQLPFLAGRYQVTKRKAEVGPTWEGTFQSSVDSLELDKVDILMETRKRQRTRDHSFSGVDNNVSGPDNAVETDDAARLFRSMPAEVFFFFVLRLPRCFRLRMMIVACRFVTFFALTCHACGFILFESNSS
jgi:hypothetical protein